jgi:NADP-reducing hydrogenase subunit HndD
VGTDVRGKMVAALRRIGFKKVFDTDFSADLTIVEEANELIERVQNGGKLPMITSCSPGWIKVLRVLLSRVHRESFHLQIAAADVRRGREDLVRGEEAGIDPKDLFVVSVMPCTAKKFECKRDGQSCFGLSGHRRRAHDS